MHLSGEVRFKPSFEVLSFSRVRINFDDVEVAGKPNPSNFLPNRQLLPIFKRIRPLVVEFKT